MAADDSEPSDVDVIDDDALEVEFDVALGHPADEAVEPLPPESDPVGTARRAHGMAGAMLAAGLFGVDIALGRKPKEEIPVVVDASGDPTDIDRDGMNFALDEGTQVVAPPLPRSEPKAAEAPGRRGH